jgi:hypothetical protein
MEKIAAQAKKHRSTKFLIAALMLGLIACAGAATGDRLNVVGQIGGNQVSIVRVTQSGQLIPGADNTYPCGISGKRWSDIRANTATFSGAVSVGSLAATSQTITTANLTTANLSQLIFTRAAAVTVSTNLTAASPTYLGLGNMTAVIYLPDATTCTIGQTFVLKNEIATAGNVGVWPTGSQTIDGAANVNITTKSVGRFVTDKVNWFAW